MADWIKISEVRPPLDTSVLGYWPGGHIEDVEFSDDGEDYIYHYLYDGESNRVEPTHWQPLPPPPEQE